MRAGVISMSILPFFYCFESSDGYHNDLSSQDTSIVRTALVSLEGVRVERLLNIKMCDRFPGFCGWFIRPTPKRLTVQYDNAGYFPYFHNQIDHQ